MTHLRSDDRWILPPPHLTLSVDQVHLWRVNLEPPANRVQHLAQTLSADEQARAQRFHFDRDRRRFIVARGSLRSLLSRYLGIPAAQVRFQYSDRGKPALAPGLRDPSPQFNLAHSQELALYGFTYNRRIGVDLEYHRSMGEAAQLVKRFFSAKEADLFFALPPEQHPAAFFHAWTQKEAYLKAIGDGLAHALDQVEVVLDPKEPAQLVSITGDRHSASQWCLQSLKVECNYTATLAVEGHGWSLSQFELDDV